MRQTRYRVKADGTEPKGAERRQFERHEDRFFIRVFGDDAGAPELCELCDISIGGIALKSPAEKLVSIDSMLVLEIPLGRSMTRLRTRGRVVNITAGEVEKLHLQFLDESDLFKSTVQKCIDEWASRLDEVPSDPSYAPNS